MDLDGDLPDDGAGVVGEQVVHRGDGPGGAVFDGQHPVVRAAAGEALEHIGEGAVGQASAVLAEKGDGGLLGVGAGGAGVGDGGVVDGGPDGLPGPLVTLQAFVLGGGEVGAHKLSDLLSVGIFRWFR